MAKMDESIIRERVANSVANHTVEMITKFGEALIGHDAWANIKQDFALDVENYVNRIREDRGLGLMSENEMIKQIAIIYTDAVEAVRKAESKARDEWIGEGWYGIKVWDDSAEDWCYGGEEIVTWYDSAVDLAGGLYCGVYYRNGYVVDYYGAGDTPAE